MKFSKFLWGFMIISAFLSGCSYLDYNESSFYKENDIFSEMNRNQGFLTNIYSYLPNDLSSFSDGSIRSSATDEAEDVHYGAVSQRFNIGAWSAVSPLDDQWSHYYAGIRAANMFLEKAAGKTFDDLKYNDSYKQNMIEYNYYSYEARFLRAFFYFELIKRYGDVPLVTKVLTPEESNKVTRTPFSEVVTFITSECDSAAAKLPVNFTNTLNKETGRVTRGTAMALKARVLLYAASPLHNPENTTDKWVAAAAASKALIDSAGRFGYILETNYNSAFNNVTSKEVIFSTRESAQNYFERYNFPVGYEGGNSGTCPTQNLVDAFEMKANGLGIDEPGSGYNPANPYAGRDPRLAFTILYNNASWKGLPVEVWTGGRNGAPQIEATKTGYYLKKYVIESINLDPNNLTSKIHNWVLFRYAEVLLNYAEAMNEAFGPDNASTFGMTARAAVNLVRNRNNVKMPLFPAGMTKDAFRTKLRNERRVELAFEDHRFWDVRRWNTGNTTTDIYGMNVEKNEDGTFTYSKKIVETRVFDEKMNLYPVPQSEIYINPALSQNPGW